MTMSIGYASVAEVKTQIETTSSNLDAVLLEAVKWVSERIDKYVEYTFAPWRNKRYFDSVGDHINRPTGILKLEYPLMNPVTVVDGNGDTLTQWDGTRANRSTADYMEEEYGKTPIWRLVRLSASVPANWTWTTYEKQSIEITGDWGYRREYSTEGWDEAATTTNEELDASETDVTVADGTVLSAGQLIRVESEYMAVTAVSGNDLTVVRGIRGTDPAVHTTGNNVDIWQPEPDIVYACARWASYLEKQRGVFDQIRIDGLGATQLPTDMPESVRNVLDRYPHPLGALSV